MLEVISEIVEKLKKQEAVSDDELKILLNLTDKEEIEILRKAALSCKEENFGKSVYFRGLIEFSNYCRKDCYYCGIRRSNKNAARYRLTEEEILSCVDYGYRQGFMTFVLQGGEDLYFTDERLVSIIEKIKELAPDAAVTLSVGERSDESLEILRKAGADRFLLRHEAIDPELYNRLHPKDQPQEYRLSRLEKLKSLGYQAGAGFMVGAPYQTVDNLVNELRFLQKFNPEMVGIGPFISQRETPFKDFDNGSVEMTLKLLALIRLLLPKVLLPATTALETLKDNGRVLGFQYGANVIMPNLTPTGDSSKYNLYDNKKGCSGYDLEGLEKELKAKGFVLQSVRGDYNV